MYWSKYFIPTLKETPGGTEAVSHQLLLRAGLVQMLTSGVYSYLPLGLRVLRRLEGIIREEMNAAGALELLLPCLHPMDLWRQTGRDQTMAEVMFAFKDNRGREMCLGPTHEEIITYLVKEYVHSYRQLPVTLYQIQTKFRDELRTRFGIVRACEFIMKDAYSFNRSTDDLKMDYQKMYDAYQQIFSRCGLDVVIVEADSGAMGGSISHEFLVAAPVGEDKVTVEVDGQSCEKPALELGHIFQLGTKYSQAMGAVYLDENGKQQPIVMGCYGIGVSRVIAAIIETNHDERGIIWPKEVAPFDVEIIPLVSDLQDEMFLFAQTLYNQLSHQGLDVLLDDRMESPGRKFNDADLIGLPLRVTIGKKHFADGKVEVKNRRTGEMNLIDIDLVAEVVAELNETGR